MIDAEAPLLPPPFADLERYAPVWALERERERVERRLASSMVEITEFYEALLPRMEAIFAHLDRCGLDELPVPERRLLWLTLSFAEVSSAVNFYGAAAIPDGFDVRRLRPFTVHNHGVPAEPAGF
jgi:hypothetical protein